MRVMLFAAVTLATAAAIFWMTRREPDLPQRGAPPPRPPSPETLVTVLYGQEGELELVLRPLHADARREAFADRALAGRLDGGDGYDYATFWALNHGAGTVDVGLDGGAVLRARDGAWEARGLDAFTAGLDRGAAFELEASAAFGRRTAGPGELLAIDVRVPVRPPWPGLRTIEGAQGLRLEPARVTARDLELFEREPTGSFRRLLRPAGERATLDPRDPEPAGATDRPR